MIRIKDYILNENDISYIVGNTDDDRELKIQWKHNTSTYIKASFEDIEWNYGQSNIKDDEYIELSNKCQRLSNRNEELEQLKEDLDTEKSTSSNLARRILKAIKLLEEDYFEDGSGNNVEEVIKTLKGEE